MTDDLDIDALREEVARLRTENEQLRSRLPEPEVKRPKPPKKESRPDRPVRVLLVPDGATAEYVRVATRVATDHLRKRQPDVEWRVEHDLACVPADAPCFWLGQVLSRIWDGTGPLPMTFRVEQADGGERRLRRCLIRGEPDSDRFCVDYERRLQIVDDLIAESQAANDAGAGHHAGWGLKAVDVVLAELKLALAHFQAGTHDWRKVLAAPAPDYCPTGVHE